ncbi:helix-turn-helix domain-containing protein [Rossellomorea vietnamensis]|uniref:Helix-turn-helix domain-containing protein n=1 Tax=Rossellomorea vietnamensis TaxID=218284 RepID=A0A6I6UME1_9BACI|nr:helix-turn-helix domain-containing protein [Rossellomorea vietnamensis]QHE59782.1 helix-turn-helix domain-containing protein [Rossellomorea vietnamensis]
MHISDLVKEFRLKNKLTLRALSVKTGISYSQLGKIERAECKPSNESVLKILDILDVELTSKDLEGLIDVKKYLKAKNEVLRYEVLSRDNFTCQLCGAAAPNIQVEIDLIDPSIRDNVKKANIDNLITLCVSCQNARHILLNEKSLESDLVYNKYKNMIQQKG